MAVIPYDMTGPKFRKGAGVSDTTDLTTMDIIGEGSDTAVFVLHNVIEFLHFVITTSGGTAINFSGFDVQAQSTASSDWVTMVDAWGVLTSTYTYEDRMVLHSKDVLETLVHGSSGSAILDVRGIFTVRFRSKQAGATASAITRELWVRATPSLRRGGG